MQLTIIVPVYNVEKYLARCIDSLLQQDLSREHYEIILIDDGSTDHSGEICDYYSCKEGNLRVYHQPNHGLSAARNKGLELAIGNYIQFVDSDDYIKPNSLKSLLSRMQADSLDVLRFNYINVNEKGEQVFPSKNGKLFSDYSSLITSGEVFLREKLGYACYACQFILRRDLAIRHPFMEGIHFEDVEWLPGLLLDATRVSSINQIVYYYTFRTGSITKSIEEAKKRQNIEDRLKSIDFMNAYKNQVADTSWFDGMISILSMTALTSVATDFYSQKRSYIHSLNDRKVRPLSLYNLTPHARWKARLINISPYLFCWLIHIK